MSAPKTWTKHAEDWRETKQWFVRNDNAWKENKKVYAHDGTDWRLVFGAGSWVTIWENNPGLYTLRGTRNICQIGKYIYALPYRNSSYPLLEIDTETMSATEYSGFSSVESLTSYSGALINANIYSSTGQPHFGVISYARCLSEAPLFNYPFYGFAYFDWCYSDGSAIVGVNNSFSNKYIFLSDGSLGAMSFSIKAIPSTYILFCPVKIENNVYCMQRNDTFGTCLIRWDLSGGGVSSFYLGNWSYTNGDSWLECVDGVLYICIPSGVYIFNGTGFDQTFPDPSNRMVGVGGIPCIASHIYGSYQKKMSYFKDGVWSEIADTPSPNGGLCGMAEINLFGQTTKRLCIADNDGIHYWDGDIS